jgi:ketosteroid isomerase-like protein
MTRTSHAIAQEFFAALSAADLPDSLLTPDMTAWTTSSGATSEKAHYQRGVAMLGTLFDGGLTFTVDSLTAQEDRVAAEVRSHGTLINGEPFANRYVFILRLRDGRIASVAEHFDPTPVQEKIRPLIQATTARKGA